MRYFAKLAYKGTNYCGWQRQPNSPSVQETIEKAFSTILRTNIEIYGCGRTDTGVHATEFFMHFDFDDDFPKGFVNRANKFLPDDIAIKRIFKVKKDAHARFDAYHRSYEYRISFQKDPILIDTIYYYPFAQQLDIGKMQAAADLLLKYDEFYPFCKSHSDANTMKCALKRAEWVENEDRGQLVFYISANRFLRGMVRLIVGMCFNIGLGKLDLDEIKAAMDKQIRLKKDLSVAAHGLFLTEVKYPFTD